MITVTALLLLLCVGRGVSSAGEERDSNYGPPIDELLDVFDIKRLSDGWQQAVTSECSDDVTSLLSALKNRTFWAQKCEYKRHGQESGMCFRAEFPKLWSADHRWSSGSALVVLLD
jgi:hypothetical protein